MMWLVIIVSAVVSGFVGYLVGVAKTFREGKQKAYVELLPPIIKMAYRSKEVNEGEFCEALSKLWLYGSKKVAKKMDHALYIAHDPKRGDMAKALKEAIVEIREDIQIHCWQQLKPEDVNHLFTRIVQQSPGKENRR